MEKGYDIKVGYVGILPNGKKILFPTEQEYLEYMEQLNTEEDSDE